MRRPPATTVYYGMELLLSMPLTFTAMLAVSQLLFALTGRTSQADAIGQAAVGPVLGVIANAYGISSGLAVGALLLSPALALYGRAIRHGGREPELEELPAAAAP